MSAKRAEPLSMKRSLVVSGIVHAFVFVGVFFMPRSSAHWDHVDAIPVDLIASVATRAKPAPAPAPAPPVPEPEVAPAPAPEPEMPKPETPEPKPKSPAPKPAAETKKAPPKRIEPRRFQKIEAPSDDRPSLEERVRQRLERQSTETPASDAAADDTANRPAQPAGSGDVTNTAVVEATDFPYAWYLNLLRRKISDAWDPPASRLLAGRANQVIIRFMLARDGAVSGVDVEVVSGAPGLDSSARQAVSRAQPFPPLPGDFPDDSVEIAVRFTVSGGGG